MTKSLNSKDKKRCRENIELILLSAELAKMDIKETANAILDEVMLQVQRESDLGYQVWLETVRKKERVIELIERSHQQQKIIKERLN